YHRPIKEGAPNVHLSYSVVADEEGRFAIERLVPGEARVGRQFKMSDSSWTTTHAERVTLSPGDTVEISLGGTGRPVVGRVTLPDGYPDAIQWGYGIRQILSLDPLTGDTPLSEASPVLGDASYAFAV